MKIKGKYEIIDSFIYVYMKNRVYTIEKGNNSNWAVVYAGDFIQQQGRVLQKKDIEEMSKSCTKFGTFYLD